MAALITYPTDLWLIERLNAAIARATKANDEFEFGEARQAAEDFFWADLCDNYLEFSKGRLYGEPLAVEPHGRAGTPAGQNGGSEEAGRSASPTYTPEQLRTSTQATLYIALSSVLRMFAPILPHITEECWSWYFAQHSAQPSIHINPWPTPVGTPLASENYQASATADAASSVPTLAAELLLGTVSAVRKWKSEQGVSIKKPLKSIAIYRLDGADVQQLTSEHLAAVLGDLLSTCNAAEAQLVDGATPDAAVTTERNPVAVVCEPAEEGAS
jgi:valyl-tRNA synthetase